MEKESKTSRREKKASWLGGCDRAQKSQSAHTCMKI